MKVKTAKVLGILISVLALFASCGQLADGGVPQGYAKVRVAAPNGRAITADEKQNSRFEYYFNDIKSDSNETIVQVGVQLRIKVIAIDARNGRQVATGEKTITVASGMNYVNIVIYEDRGAYVNANMVRWSAGVATVGNVQNIPSEESHQPDDIVTVPAQEPTWEYATSFQGWSYGNVSLVDENDSPISGNLTAGKKFKFPNGGVTLTAEWQVTSYTISYNNGGVATANNDSVGATTFTMAETDDKQLSTMRDTATSDVKNFLGWSNTNGDTAAKITGTKSIREAVVNGSLVPSGGSVTLYAVWSTLPVYQVTLLDTELRTQEYWNTNANNTVNVSEGQTVTIQQIQNFLDGGAKSGYTLTYSGSASSAITSAQNFTIDASKVSFDTTYTVTLNANALSGQEFWNSNNSNTVQVQKGQSVTTQQIQSFLTGGAKNGYTLTYSGSGSSAINSKNDADAGVTIQLADVTWTTTYTVNINFSSVTSAAWWNSSSSSTPVTKSVQKGGSVTAQEIQSEIDSRKKPNYTVTYNGGNKTISSQADININITSGDVTANGVTQANITFNTTQYCYEGETTKNNTGADYNYTSVSNKAFTIGEALSTVSFTLPVGGISDTFAGWALETAPSGTVYTQVTEENIATLNGKTLIAIWEKAKFPFKVTYSNGGDNTITGLPNAVNCIVGDATYNSFKLDSGSSIRKTDSKFIGWHSTYKDGINNTDGANVTLSSNITADELKDTYYQGITDSGYIIELTPVFEKAYTITLNMFGQTKVLNDLAENEVINEKIMSFLTSECVNPTSNESYAYAWNSSKSDITADSSKTINENDVVAMLDITVTVTINVTVKQDAYADFVTSPSTAINKETYPTGKAPTKTGTITYTYQYPSNNVTMDAKTLFGAQEIDGKTLSASYVLDAEFFTTGSGDVSNLMTYLLQDVSALNGKAVYLRYSTPSP